MRISQLFNLNKTQSELDFVDIDIDVDTPLFIDPFLIGQRQDNWSFEVNRTIDNFFSLVITYIQANSISKAKQLFDFLSEPNETCFGISSNKPKGRGVGKTDTNKLFKSFLRSNAIHSGLIKDLEDSILFVDNFNKDKLSDMTTNIIMKHLIEYTKNQCDYHNIPVKSGTPSPFYWNPVQQVWENALTDILVVKRKKIILVPKSIVSYKSSYTPNVFMQHFVLNFLQSELIRSRHSLVQRRVDGTPFITKKSIRENIVSKYGSDKDFLREYSKKHPQILNNFKTRLDTRPMTNLELSSDDVNKIVSILKQKLDNVATGTATANEYHDLIKGILELIFYPHLINPIKEREIDDGRKRIDISFDNASEKGIFERLSTKHNIFCPYIFIECKNYSTDLKNPELDQMAGRFSVNRGKVGFIVCRKFDNRKLFIKRCRDNYTAGRGLIIPLVDDDIVELLDNVNEWNFDKIDQILSNKVREIIN